MGSASAEVAERTLGPSSSQIAFDASSAALGPIIIFGALWLRATPSNRPSIVVTGVVFVVMAVALRARSVRRDGIVITRNGVRVDRRPLGWSQIIDITVSSRGRVVIATDEKWAFPQFPRAGRWVPNREFSAQVETLRYAWRSASAQQSIGRDLPSMLAREDSRSSDSVSRA